MTRRYQQHEPSRRIIILLEVSLSSLCSFVFLLFCLFSFIFFFLNLYRYRDEVAFETKTCSFKCRLRDYFLSTRWTDKADKSRCSVSCFDIQHTFIYFYINICCNVWVFGSRTWKKSNECVSYTLRIYYSWSRDRRERGSFQWRWAMILILL